MLSGADRVVTEVTELLGPSLDKREELRSGLQALNLVRQFRPTDALTVAGVDGGFAVERTAAVDLLLAVAVGVEGLSDRTTPWDSTQYKWWSRVSKHDQDAERMARGAMVAQELAILHAAPHDLRILDGSHLTLVIQLNSALTSSSDDIRRESLRLWQDLGTVGALQDVCSSDVFIAMPKYDSSRTVTELLEKHFATAIPGDDKYLMGLLLNAGEVLIPQQVPHEPWAALHFTAFAPTEQQTASDLTKAIDTLKRREIAFTYFKPERFSPAFRIELKRSLPLERLDAICSTIAGQITGPFVREPYPQYLADVMAKSVGLGLSALQTAVQLGLSGLGRPEIAEFLVHSYRTEGI
ncbi:MAG: DNA double-strand break repair nuclease NurA [Candidatus Limnocylindria bacterium]